MDGSIPRFDAGKRRKLDDPCVPEEDDDTDWQQAVKRSGAALEDQAADDGRQRS